MTASLTPLHEDLSFNSPLSDETAATLISGLGDVGTATVVDIGCGWAELLLRILAANPRATGIGYDTNGQALAHGRANASARGLAERADLIEGDAATTFTGRADVLVSIGASQVWGDNAAALAALRGHLPTGGQLIYGDGFWRQPPTPAALAALGATPEELTDLNGLTDAAVAAGFRPYAVIEATQSEWDLFESGYSRGYERWLVAHDESDADFAGLRDEADAHRRGYLHGYRGVLGLAYLHLVAV